MHTCIRLKHLHSNRRTDDKTGGRTDDRTDGRTKRNHTNRYSNILVLVQSAT